MKYNPGLWETRDARSSDALMDLHLLSCLTTTRPTAKRSKENDELTNETKWEKKEKGDERLKWDEVWYARCVWEIKSFNVWTLCRCQRRRVQKNVPIVMKFQMTFYCQEYVWSTQQCTHQQNASLDGLRDVYNRSTGLIWQHWGSNHKLTAPYHLYIKQEIKEGDFQQWQKFLMRSDHYS